MRTQAHFFSFILPLAALSWFAGHLAAQTTFAWNGSSGDWNNASNWTPNGVPGPNDSAILASGAATLDADASVAGFTLSGGALNGSGKLTITKTMTWTAGTMGASGITQVAPGATLQISGSSSKRLDGRKLVNAGTTAWKETGIFQIRGGAEFDNQGTFDIQTDTLMTTGGPILPNTFINRGTVIKSAGAGTTTIRVTFNNEGSVIAVRSGTLRLINGGSFTNATFNVTGGATLLFDGGTYILSETISASPSGKVELKSGALEAPVRATFDFSGTMFEWSGGTLAGNGALTVRGPFNISGNDRKRMDIRTVINQGTTTWTGTGEVQIKDGAQFDNRGTFDIRNDALIRTAGSPPNTFVSSGTVVKSEGTGTTTFDLTFNNNGSVLANVGTMRFQKDGIDAGSYTIASGATLSFAGGNRTLTSTAAVGGTGTVSFTRGNVINNGNFNPGTSPGILNISGNYSQTALANLNIDLAGLTVGSEFDRLAVNGAAQLDGALNVTLENGFMPARGSKFEVLTYTSRDGAFNNIRTPRFDADPTYLTTGLVLTMRNNHPDAIDDQVTTERNVAVAIDVLANDSDADGDMLSVIGFTQPESGTVAPIDNVTLRYTPPENFSGTDLFDYVISDGMGGVDTATVTVVTNAPANNAPVAANDVVITLEDTPVTIDVLANDTDPDGDALSLLSFTQGSRGSVAENENGTLTYTPVENFFGDDSFLYVVTDGNGGVDTAGVNITVNPVNDSPLAEADSVTTDEDVPVTVDVLANDSDVDGDTLAVTNVTQGGHGSVTNNGDGTVTYAPATDFNGSDRFDYVISDGNGGVAIATVAVTVKPVNDPPVATNNAVTTLEDTSATIAVLDNDTDPDGDALSILSFTQGSRGSVAKNEDGTVTYTPVENFFGADSFLYVVTDGNGGVDTAEVNVTVNPINDPPRAEADSVTTDEDVPVTIHVLANDSDVDEDALTVANVTQGGNGSVENNDDGTVTYAPAVNFNGADRFDYIVSDGNGGVATATVTVTIKPVNDLPTFSHLPDTVRLASGASDTLNMWDYVEDVESPDSLLTFEYSANPQFLIFTFNSKNGSLIIAAVSGYSGEVTAKIKATDPDGGAAEDSLLVIVLSSTAVEDFPAGQIPKEFVLMQNYPNPFNPGTRIRFGLPKASHIKLEVYNILGQRVATLVDGRKTAGYHVIDFDAKGLPGGLYFYRLQAGEFIEVKKMVVRP
jgi:hypothetical protein